MTTIVSASQSHHKVNRLVKLLEVKNTNIGGACHTVSHVVYSVKILSGYRLKDTNIWELVCGKKQISFK
jgi:hypothetical protein